MNTLYAAVGFTCMIVSFIIMRCSDALNRDDAGKKGKLRRIFSNFALFGFIDGLWGLCAAYSAVVGYWPFWIASFLFHLMASISAYNWFAFSSKFFGYEGGNRGKIVEALPAIVCLYFLIQQLFTNKVFYIDSELNYRTGGLRPFLFYIQFFYYVYALVKWAVYRNLMKRSGENAGNLRHSRAVYFFLVIPILTGVLQMLDPGLPFYSLGFLIMATVVFDGTIVLDKNHESINYQKISKETYGALEALCQSYVSVHLFDLVSNRQNSVKSTPYVDFYIEDGDPGDVQIRKVMQGVTVPAYTQEVVEFVDFSTLQERMMGKDRISKTFEGKNVGWCESSFICVQRDDEGKVVKVIHVVRDIDDIKRKEAEYTLALTRAYRNKNAIYAEILQMQDVGVTATDKDNKIILANDMALHQFNKDGINVEGMDFLTFVEDSEFKYSEEIEKKYLKIRESGGSLTYEMKVLVKNEDYADNKDTHYRYILNYGRLLTLLDGTKAMLNCYTDVTQSKLLEEKLRVMSEVDALTQIANRGCGESEIEELFKEKVEGLFCLIDVNKFKSINDTFGHKAGDDVLKEVAGCLKSTFRSDDVVMRLGGDEFAIFAKNVTSRELAEIRLARLFENIRRIEVEGVPKSNISISLGAVFVKIREDGAAEDYASVYKKADTVMYECKNRGGNNLKFYDDVEKNGK